MKGWWAFIKTKICSFSRCYKFLCQAIWIAVSPDWLQEMQVAEAERERRHRIWLVQDELTALKLT
ncbi:hypothetical protein LC20_07515 [Yersinia hibernica]|uniref:Uncharacterized protein n=1 Tax=Yersinia enterocolitica LC20 TaxID=1443113 RepID=A0A7U5PGZ3_YEREN|nr:hypothetical protein LC20_07515 [Yersinia hibernica]